MDTSKTEQRFARADKEIAQGRYWRAKELLRGQLAASGYDCALFARFALVLEKMGDLDEAGRYYFLSGCRNGSAGELAGKFLQRRRSRSTSALWSEMPVAARKTKASSLPASVVFDLDSIGADLQQIDQMCSRSSVRKVQVKPSDMMRATFAPHAIGAALVVVVVLGVIELGKWILTAARFVFS